MAALMKRVVSDDDDLVADWLILCPPGILEYVDCVFLGELEVDFVEAAGGIPNEKASAVREEQLIKAIAAVKTATTILCLSIFLKFPFFAERRQ